jgi:hypothetical protein
MNVERFRDKKIIAKLVLLIVTWLTVAYFLLSLKSTHNTMSISTMRANMEALQKYDWAISQTSRFIVETTSYLGVPAETVKSVGSMMWRKIRARNLTFKKRNAIELAARVTLGLGAAYASNRTGVNRIARNALAPVKLYNSIKYQLVNKPGFFNMGAATRNKELFNNVQSLLISLMGLLAQFEYNVTMEVARTIIPQNSPVARSVTNGIGATLRLTSGFAYSANNGKRTQQVARNVANLGAAITGATRPRLVNNLGKTIY